MKILKVLIPKWMSIISFEDGTGPAMDFEGMSAGEAVTLFMKWERLFLDGGFPMETNEQIYTSLNDWIRYYNRHNESGIVRKELNLENNS